MKTLIGVYLQGLRRELSRPYQAVKKIYQGVQT
jgi:hypothetical protein